MELRSGIILTAFFVTIAQSADIRAWDKRGAMSYVVDKGCPFLAHYVRDNYFDYAWLKPPSTANSISITTVTMETTTLPTSDLTIVHINWVSEVYKQFVKEYVPIELFKGLVNCGREYALYSINAPSDLTKILNVDYGSVPGIGK